MDRPSVRASALVAGEPEGGGGPPTNWLREREAVLASIAGCLQAARSGRGQALFIIGEAGLGKTSLLAAACARSEPDMECGRGRADPLGAAVPFGLAFEAISGLGGPDPFGRPREASMVDPGEPYYRFLRWMDQRPDRPLLLALDDLHWADADSLRVLTLLARRIARYPVALIASLRPWPAQALDICRDLADAGEVSLQRLGPLSRAAAGGLLADLAGDTVTAGIEERVWRLCRGNPLLIRHVACAVREGEEVPEFGEAGPLPAGFEGKLLLARFVGYHPEGLRLARAASALGIVFRPALAAQVAGLTDAEHDAAFDSLCRSGVLVPGDDGTMGFAHPLYAEALYKDLPAPLRLGLHRRAFSILAGRHRDAEAAEHALRGELVGDEQATSLLERVGSAALAAGAVAQAERWLQGAARLSGSLGRPETIIALAEALVGAEKPDRAVVELQGCLARDNLTWTQRHQALRSLGRALVWTGALGPSQVALDMSVDLAVANGQPGLAVLPLLDLCLTLDLIAGPAAALAPAARARELAAGAGADVRERVEVTWARMAFETGHAEGLAAGRLRRQLDRGSALSGSNPEEFSYPWGTLEHYALLAMMAEDLPAAERACRAVQAAAERAGAVASLLTSAITLAVVLIRRGRPAEALAVAARATDLVELCPPARSFLELTRAESLLWLGHLDECEETCAAVERLSHGLWYERLCLAHVRGLLLLWRGDTAASEQFLAAESLTASGGLQEPCLLHWAGHAIEAHLAVGRVEDARRVLAWLEACASRLPCRWPRITAALGRAALAWRGGHDDAAAGAFQCALGLHEEVDLPLQRAEALLAFGTYLRRRGRLVEARSPLAQAERTAQAAGAAWLARRAHEELTLARGRRRRPSGGGSSLSEAESRVAELAAQGHTNAEIARSLRLSVNTVETHLRHIFDKLRLRSRRELMRLEEQRRVEPPSSVRPHDRNEPGPLLPAGEPQSDGEE